MAKGREYTVVGYLIKPESVDKDFEELTKDDVTPIEELTPEQKDRWRRESTERMKRVMTDYYRQHPDEFALLPDAEPNGECT